MASEQSSQVSSGPAGTEPAAKLSRPVPSNRRGWVLVWLVGIGGLVLSVLAYGLLSFWERRLAEAQFRLDAERRVEAIQRALADRLDVMRALAAFYAGSHTVEREEFHTFSRPLLSEHTGIEALGWAPRITSARRNQHRQTVRGEGFPEYQIVERDAQGRFDTLLVVAGGQREEYFPVSFIEPHEANRAAFGFDLGSNPACREALAQASRTGRMAAVRMIPPGKEIGGLPALFVMVPVGQGAEGPETPEGFVLGVFRIGAIVEDALGYYPPSGIDIGLFDESSSAEASLLYTHVSRTRQPSKPPRPLLEKPPAAIHHTGHFAVADRQWTVSCTPTGEYLARHRTWGPLGTLVAGSLLTGLLVGYLALLTGRAARVEKLVAARTAELRMISKAALDPLVMMDSDGNVAHWNPAAQRVFGYRGDEILGRKVHTTLVPQRYQDRAQREMREFVRNGRGPVVGKVLELEAVRKDGTEFPIEISVSSICQEGGFWAVAIIRDITARKRAEEAVQNERRLLRELLNLQERERKLVAYDIHDGLAQQLTGALFKFQAFRRQWGEEVQQVESSHQAHAAFDAAMQLLGESLDEARRLISGLRPPILDEFGIVAAIDYLICEHQERGGPEIEFTHRVRFYRVAPPLETAVFRIVQESLTNACRHSQSERVRVELTQRDNSIHLEVQDWGIGFVPSTVVESHFGLQGIRERARLLAGRVSVETAPGEGTKIIVELPLLEHAPEKPELQPH